MKTSRFPFLLAVALVGGACGSPTAPSGPIAFVHTESFGFCFPPSYCTSRLELFPRQAVMTYESRVRGKVVQRRAVDSTLWTRALQSLDVDALRALPAVVGCPDCLDGGAEKVEVAFGDGDSASVTFEYGEDVQGIEEVVGVLREIRRSFSHPDPVEAP